MTCLYMQAVIEGKLDADETDVLSGRWWQKCYHVIDYLARQIRVDLYKAKMQFGLAELAGSGDTIGRDKAWEQAEHARNSLVAESMPWLDVRPRSPAETIAAMRDKYVRTFGDPKDPEFQKEMKRLLDYWESNKRANAMGSVQHTGFAGS